MSSYQLITDPRRVLRSTDGEDAVERAKPDATVDGGADEQCIPGPDGLAGA